MLLGLACHNTVLEREQVVIKTAVIPSMNISWARLWKKESKSERWGKKDKGKETDVVKGTGRKS